MSALVSPQDRVNVGRELLGRHVRVGRRKFKALGVDDAALGNYCVRKSMLAAIRKASVRSVHA